MIPFCGYDDCSIDCNGRIKLSPAVIADFGGNGASVVMRCLPEGAIGVYSESVFSRMRQAETEKSLSEVAMSVLYRRNLRVLNAMSQPAEISPQGRITLPVKFRHHAKLDEAPEAVVVGVEIGVEIWSAQMWHEEEARMLSHLQTRNEIEMQADLDTFNIKTSGKEENK